MKTEEKGVTLSKKSKWKKWGKAIGIILIIVALLDNFASITGYSLRDLIENHSKYKLKQNEKTEQLIKPSHTPSNTQKKEMAKPPILDGKNNVNIEVKDKAKVGIINTGDSSTINAKQEF